MTEDNEILLDEERGMYPKYRAFKIDQNGMQDGEIELAFRNETNEIWYTEDVSEVKRSFLLLMFDDVDAHDALLVYAQAKAERYPLFATDIREMVGNAHLQLLKDRLSGNQGEIPAPLGSVASELAGDGRDAIVEGLTTAVEKEREVNRWWICTNRGRVSTACEQKMFPSPVSDNYAGTMTRGALNGCPRCSRRSDMECFPTDTDIARNTARLELLDKTQPSRTLGMDPHATDADET